MKEKNISYFQPDDMEENKLDRIKYFSKLWLKEVIIMGNRILRSTEEKYKEFENYHNYKFKFDPELSNVIKILKKSNLFKPNYGFDYNMNKKIQNEIEKYENYSIFIALNYSGNTEYPQIYYFIHSLKQSLNFLKVLQELDNNYKDVYDNLHKSLLYVDEIRNINEHYIDYLLGKGHYQDKLFVIDKNESSVADATSIIANKKENEIEIKIGNRLNVLDCIHVAEKALVEIILLEKKHSNY